MTSLGRNIAVGILDMPPILYDTTFHQQLHSHSHSVRHYLGVSSLPYLVPATATATTTTATWGIGDWRFGMVRNHTGTVHTGNNNKTQ